LPMKEILVWIRKTSSLVLCICEKLILVGILKGVLYMYYQLRFKLQIT